MVACNERNLSTATQNEDHAEYLSTIVNSGIKIILSIEDYSNIDKLCDGTNRDVIENLSIVRVNVFFKKCIFKIFFNAFLNLNILSTQSLENSIS